LTSTGGCGQWACAFFADRIAILGKEEKEMTKNLILGFTLGALAVVLALVLTGQLVWKDDDIALLERRIEAHTPRVIEIGGEQLLCLALTRQSGKSWSVDHAFYILKDGKLTMLSLNQNN
jgi:hypothetical protein